jgi:hypothetical protein
MLTISELKIIAFFPKKKRDRSGYLLVDEVGPESGLCPRVRVGGEERRPVEGLVDVLDDDERLGDGPIAVE